MSIGIAVIWVEPSVAETLGPNARKGCSHKKKKKAQQLYRRNPRNPPPPTLLSRWLLHCTWPPLSRALSQNRRRAARSPIHRRAPQIRLLPPSMAAPSLPFFLLRWRPVRRVHGGEHGLLPPAASPLPLQRARWGARPPGVGAPQAPRRPLLPLLPLPSHR
jgi:hypothetical protein